MISLAGEHGHKRATIDQSTSWGPMVADLKTKTKI